MGRFDAKYTDEQRQAIIDAQVEGKLSAAKACRAAAEGKLGLPAFEFAEGTAGHYAAQERRRRRGQEQDAKTRSMDPEKRLDALATRFLAMLEHEANRLEKAQPKAGYSPEDLAKMKAALGVARELRSLLRGMAPIKGGGKQAAQRNARAEPPSSPDDRTQAVLHELQSALESRRATESLQENGRETGGGALAHEAPAVPSEPVPA